MFTNLDKMASVCMSLSATLQCGSNHPTLITVTTLSQGLLLQLTTTKGATLALFGVVGKHADVAQFILTRKLVQMAQLMSIVNQQKSVSAKLNGCSGVCVVGATAGLSVTASLPCSYLSPAAGISLALYY